MTNDSQPRARDGAPTVDGSVQVATRGGKHRRQGVSRPGSGVLTLATVIVEMIPGGLGPWGVGDLMTAIEAIAGRTLDGLKLSGSERLIYLGASAIPLVPARPIIGAYQMLIRTRELPSMPTRMPKGGRRMSSSSSPLIFGSWVYFLDPRKAQVEGGTPVHWASSSTPGAVGVHVCEPTSDGR